MKKIFVLLFLVSLTPALRAQQGFDAGELDAIARGERESAASLFRPARPETGGNYDVSWYGCNWNIDPGVRIISGSVTMLFRTTGAGASSVTMDLHSALVTDSVVFHGQPAAFLHQDNLLAISLPAVVHPSLPDSVTVYYHGIPPDSGFGSFAQAMHDNTPIIWTLSEPYGSSEWWPCKDGLTDKPDSIDIRIRTPLGLKAASNGLLVSVTQEEAGLVLHWKHRYPIAPYLVCLAVTNYAEYQHHVFYDNGVLPVVNYVYPEDSVTASQQTGVVVPMIELFDSLFGLYPFRAEKYGHAQFGWGGGMEHQTMTFLGSFGFELIAHELAHMWFGDKVTCGSWTDIWLNEGFATYLSGLCYEFLAPVYWKRFREVRVESIVSQPAGSVYCADTTSVSRIFDGRLSYAKGAMILHQLRWLMGDSAFFTAVNNYLSDPAIAYGFARTPQLKAHLEASSGRDLTGYFDDWYTGEGYPSYQLGWEQQDDTVTVTVHQSQSHPSVSFFEMEIPVRFSNAQHDTILRFSHTAQGQTFTAFLPFTADSAAFDPDCQLITKNNTVSAVTEPPAALAFRVFPNPAKGQVNFAWNPAQVNANWKLTLFDPAGKKVKSATGAAVDGEYTLRTDRFPAGVYFYRFEYGRRVHTGKVTFIRPTGL